MGKDRQSSKGQCADSSAGAQDDGHAASRAILAQAGPFIGAQPLVAVASIDVTGAVWVSLVFGRPGFLRASDGATVALDVPPRERDLADPVWENMGSLCGLGLLFIDLRAGRRYRVSGNLLRLDARGAWIAVREADALCPAQFRRRALRHMGEPRLPVQAAQGKALRGVVERIVRQADMLFVGSRHAGQGALAAHRRGRPGFVTVVDHNMLRIPDRAGPSSRTLANLAADPRAGIAILDFDGGQVLQLTGKARLAWHCSGAGDAGRCWEFKVERWILRDTPQAMRWDDPGFAPDGAA